jgi:hypothetical protein
MSSYLRGRKFWLGRNAKILAAQPLTRLAEKASLPSTSLLWRAILQVDLGMILNSDFSYRWAQVSKIAVSVKLVTSIFS